MVDTIDGSGESERRYPPYLRLAWSNPNPPRSRVRLDLAVAIERHLAGTDGLSREQFLALFSGRSPLRPSSIPCPS
jgi:hypothetical protein